MNEDKEDLYSITSSASTVETDTFYSCIKSGKESEKAFLKSNVFSSIFYDTNTIDVADFKEWQKKDVDILCIRPESSNYWKVEIKKGIYAPGKIIIEMVDNMSTNHVGWYYKSSADIMVWINEGMQCAVLWKDFREFFSENYRNPESSGFFLRRITRGNFYCKPRQSLLYEFYIKHYIDHMHEEGRIIPWLLFLEL